MELHSIFLNEKYPFLDTHGSEYLNSDTTGQNSSLPFTLQSIHSVQLNLSLLSVTKFNFLNKKINSLPASSQFCLQMIFANS